MSSFDKRIVVTYFLNTDFFEMINGTLLTKLFWPTARKNCSSDREKLLKLEAEGRKFANLLRSLEQFIQIVKGQKSVLLTKCFFNLFLEVSHV